MQDEFKNQLDAMDIPEPSTGAAQRVVSHARAMQQEGTGIWLRFNRFRTWLFQLHMRYIVMASVVLIFAVIGRIGQMPNAQTMAQTDPLVGIEFAVEGWAEEAFFMAQDEPQPSAQEVLEGIDFEIDDWSESVDWSS